MARSALIANRHGVIAFVICAMRVCCTAPAVIGQDVDVPHARQARVGSVRNIHDNTASQNSSFGIRVLNPPGTVLRNTANMNGNAGILLQSSVLDGAVSENTAMTNLGAGIVALTTGDGTSTFSAESNVLSGNNSGGSEFVVARLGSGALILTFSGNMSSNAVPAGQFNFDLFNTQPGTFSVSPAGVDSANSPGTVGSSDSSVTIP